MIVETFDPKKRIDPFSDSIIASSVSRFYGDLSRDCYVIKMPISAPEVYYVEDINFYLKTTTFLAANPGQQIIGEIDHTQPVDSLCLNICKNTMQGAVESCRGVLAEPKSDLDLPEIVPHAYPLEFTKLGRFLNRFKLPLFYRRIPEGFDKDWFFQQICHLLLAEQVQVSFDMSKLDNLQTATRQELYRRINFMHQFILSEFRNDLSLDDLAKSAYLSKFHALRLYKKMYGCTPYQHIQRLRMEESLRLLKKHSITEVSGLLNFTDRRAFSKAFKKYYGQSPSAYLNQ